jgi:hypothetical protein
MPRQTSPKDAVRTWGAPTVRAGKPLRPSREEAPSEASGASLRSFDFSRISITPPPPPSASPERTAAAIRDAARDGTRGAGGPLPHGEAIQRSFGRHDISRVRTHADGAAAAAATRMKAGAFTVGEHLAFAGPPGLRLAAHEAAHAVQQRAGARPDGGVGRDGDVFERLADAVAERVVRGASSEALLDKLAAGPRAGAPSGGRAAPAVQLASWSSLYGTNAEDKAKAVKAQIGDARPGWSAASDLASGGKKGTKVYGFKLTAADILEVIRTAESERGVNNILGQPGTADRKTHEDQIASYVQGMAAAFDVMEIDTVESQAAFAAHAVGETLLSRFTEAQTKLFVDDPKKAVVSTSLMTDKKDPTGKSGQILGPRRYRGITNIDPTGVIPDKDKGMAAEDFNKTFIGRGPIQVTDRDNYMKTLMYMETRADLLQETLDKVPKERSQYRAELTEKLALVREAMKAIEADPTAAADPKYAFLFSAAFMHTSVLLQTTASFGPEKDFTKSAGFGGGFKDDRGPQKTKAYKKAYELLIERNFGHQARMPEQYEEPRKWHPPPPMP